MIPEEIGRLDSSEVGEEILHDSPEKQMQAVMSKLDEIHDAIVALDAANTGVPEVAALAKIKLRL